MIPALALVACSSPSPAPPPKAQIREELILSRPMPDPGPNARAMARLTSDLGIGMVRCPLAGGGKARVRHGTPRDGMLYWGLLLSMESDPAHEPVWNPVFDQVTGEQDWVALPAMPGATRSWIDTQTRTLELDHPAAVTGQTVVCTAVRELGTRELHGRVDGEVPPGSHFVPCFKESPAVASDGTFVADVPVPCTGWVEGGGMHSDALRIDAGDGPVEHTFTLAPDRWQRADRSWTPEGLVAAREALGRLDRSRERSAELLERLKEELRPDPEAADALAVWKTGLWEQQLLIENAAKSIGPGSQPGKAVPAPAE